MKTVEELRDYWNKEARFWTQEDEHFTKLRVDGTGAIIRATLAPYMDILIRNEGEILDLGSGGTPQVYFPGLLIPRLVAVDIADVLLEANPAKEKIVSDIREPLPFTVNRFDLVTMLFLNRYLLNQDRVIRDAYRVLNRESRLIMIDHTFMEHPEEVSIFEPSVLSSVMEEIGFNEIETRMLVGGVNGRKLYNRDFSRGPIHLVTGVKN